jgi:hypothetical protein
VIRVSIIPTGFDRLHLVENIDALALHMKNFKAGESARALIVAPLSNGTEGPG